MTHYIAMAGLHGYSPNYVSSCDTYSAAVDSLVQLHELGRRRAAILKRDSYLELRLRRDGNEYCEVMECDCADPAIHGED